MPAIRLMAHRFAVYCALIVASALSVTAQAQNIPGIDPNIEAELVAESSAVPGEEVTVAIYFEPVSADWHGYWKNPGDAGYGMQLEWDLPEGWVAGEPEYPVPQKLLIGDLMNHIYEGPHAVLIPMSVPDTATVGDVAQVGLKAEWLACTDVICVPEKGSMQATIPVGERALADARFGSWRNAIPPMIDSVGGFQIAGETLRLSIPIPAEMLLTDTHVFVAELQLGDGLKPAYAAAQNFMRQGDRLIAQIPLTRLIMPPDAGFEFEPRPESITGILALGGDTGLRFQAAPATVASIGGASDGITDSLALLLLAALAGGLILNIMPCVFPILSLKALSLARAGGSESEARKEGLAYSAGVILACVALGAAMLALRAAGEQIGWAFQLQEPGIVAALLVLATLITANLAGVFELPSVALTRSGEPASAFATGLLAAIAATPCTGPFMAAALGAALLLPTAQALLLFAALGLGLALPFLLIGFVPPLRRLLPKPGRWMETFRKIMAVPMGLTALALVWLVWQLGGPLFAIYITCVAIGLLLVVLAYWGTRRNIRMSRPAFAAIFMIFTVLSGYQAYQNYQPPAFSSGDSILSPKQYSANELAKARASGKPVFVWFTAHWCVTCKVNEGVAIERQATRAAFEQAGVIAIRGDWSLPDPEITQYLNAQGAAGIPLYVWYAPGGEAQILPQILTPDSLVTLARNSGSPAPGTSQ